MESSRSGRSKAGHGEEWANLDTLPKRGRPHLEHSYTPTAFSPVFSFRLKLISLLVVWSVLTCFKVVPVDLALAPGTEGHLEGVLPFLCQMAESSVFFFSRRIAGTIQPPKQQVQKGSTILSPSAEARHGQMLLSAETWLPCRRCSCPFLWKAEKRQVW